MNKKRSPVKSSIKTAVTRSDKTGAWIIRGVRPSSASNGIETFTARKTDKKKAVAHS